MLLSSSRTDSQTPEKGSLISPPDDGKGAHLTQQDLLLSCWRIFGDKHAVGHVSELRRPGACQDGDGGVGALVAVLIRGLHGDHVLLAPCQGQARRPDNPGVCIDLKPLLTTYQGT